MKKNSRLYTDIQNEFNSKGYEYLGDMNNPSHSTRITNSIRKMKGTVQSLKTEDKVLVFYFDNYYFIA